MADWCCLARSEKSADKRLAFPLLFSCTQRCGVSLMQDPTMPTTDTADSPPEILYREGPCLVINKPSGLLTQAPAGIDNLEVRIKAFIKHQEEKTGNVYLGLPHRLDRPASGAMVFARHVRAARRLSKQFEDRSVSKIYWALVEGDLQPDEGTWTDYLHKRHGMAEAIVVPEDDPRGKQAVLHYRVMGRTADASWLEIELETGRTHQIRVQAASRGYPILGDRQYGSTRLFGPPHDDVRLRAIALHARQLGFAHPMTRAAVEVVAPVSDAWLSAGIAELVTGCKGP